MGTLSYESDSSQREFVRSTSTHVSAHSPSIDSWEGYTVNSKLLRLLSYKDDRVAKTTLLASAAYDDTSAYLW